MAGDGGEPAPSRQSDQEPGGTYPEVGRNLPEIHRKFQAVSWSFPGQLADDQECLGTKVTAHLAATSTCEEDADAFEEDDFHMLLGLTPFWPRGAGVLRAVGPGIFPLALFVGARPGGVRRAIEHARQGRAARGTRRRPAPAVSLRRVALRPRRRRKEWGGLAVGPGPRALTRCSGPGTRSAAKTAAEVADFERRRIARDLHDGLQVHLVLLGLQAQQVATEANGVTAQRAMALREGIDSAAAQLRQVVHGLLPPALVERGLCAATEDLFDRLPVPAGLRLSVPDGSLPPFVESAAYFVVAEAVTNALKHSRARQLEASIEVAGGKLIVDVRDDGVGGAHPAGGSGLAGLAERVRTLGGVFQVESPMGEGTHVRALLPYAA
jgi:signal transduction histidine kinase